MACLVCAALIFGQLSSSVSNSSYFLRAPKWLGCQTQEPPPRNSVKHTRIALSLNVTRVTHGYSSSHPLTAPSCSSYRSSSTTTLSLRTLLINQSEIHMLLCTNTQLLFMVNLNCRHFIRKKKEKKSCY